MTPSTAATGGAEAGPEFVRLEVESGIGTIWLDRPPMNALSRQVQDELSLVVDQAAVRDDVRAVVVFGGEKTLAAGADVKELAALSHADIASQAGKISAGLGAVGGLAKPTVAAVTGFALGGGLEVALGADRRIAGENAALGFPEILLGLIPGGGGTQRLARLVGPVRAKDLIYTGRTVDAEEALAIGLVDEVVPAGEVYSRSVEYASQFADGPALAYAAAKKAIDGGMDTDLRTGLDLESALFTGLFASDDARTGIRSFVEKGPGKATFSGR